MYFMDVLCSLIISSHTLHRKLSWRRLFIPFHTYRRFYTHLQQMIFENIVTKEEPALMSYFSFCNNVLLWFYREFQYFCLAFFKIVSCWFAAYVNALYKLSIKLIAVVLRTKLFQNPLENERIKTLQYDWINILFSA